MRFLALIRRGTYRARFEFRIGNSTRPIHEKAQPPLTRDFCLYRRRPIAFVARYVGRYPIAHAVILVAVLGAVTCSVSTQYGVKRLVDALSQGAGHGPDPLRGERERVTGHEENEGQGEKQARLALGPQQEDGKTGEGEQQVDRDPAEAEANGPAPFVGRSHEGEVPGDE